MRQFIIDRCNELNQGLIDCYQLEGPYTLEFQVDPPGAGDIKVNSQWLDAYPWMGTYFGGIDVIVKARENTGWTFDEWEIVGGVDPLTPNKDTIQAAFQPTGNRTIIAHFVEEGDPTYDGVSIPTAFSPNNDGNNDVLQFFVGADVTSFAIEIYNRWGEMVFKATEGTDTWDGSYKGADLNSGVFVYRLDVQYNDGSSDTQNGNITLLR